MSAGTKVRTDLFHKANVHEQRTTDTLRDIQDLIANLPPHELDPTSKVHMLRTLHSLNRRNR